jgi:hypothetical protein
VPTSPEYASWGEFQFGNVFAWVGYYVLGAFERVPAWKHSLMKNSSDANPRPCPAKEDHMFTVLNSPHPGTKSVTSPTQVGRFSNTLEAVYETIEVNLSLFGTPSVNRIVKNRLEIEFGQF